MNREIPMCQMDNRSEPLPVGFYVLLGAYFIAFSTLSIFFNFENHLQSQGVASQWAGLLLSLFALSALVLRPFISPFLNAGNAARWTNAGTVGMIVSLFIYPAASPIWPLALVRVLHGISYVVLATSLMAWMVSLIPRNRSGIAFGLIAICNLIPYALVPILVDWALAHGAAYWTTFTFAGVALLLEFPLIYAADKTTIDQRDRRLRSEDSRMTWKEIRENLACFEIPALLVFALMTYTSFAVVFFYIKGFAKAIGVAEVGPFFLIITAVMIGVRLFGIKWFDRIDKGWVCSGCLAALTVVFALMGQVGTSVGLYLAGGIFGLAWGSLMPLLSAMVFDFSPQRFRAMNSNLVVEMVDGGFALGPLVGGLVLCSRGYPFLFIVLAVINGACLFLTIPLSRKEKP
jgi:MFS family permease